MSSQKAIYPTPPPNNICAYTPIAYIRYDADIRLILLPNEFPRFTSENGARVSQYVFTNANVRKKSYPPNKHQSYLPMSFVVFFTSFAVKIGKKKCGATTYLSW